MHRCAATCYDNESLSVHRVANCVENCSSTLNNAQQYITGEIERVQVLIFSLQKEIFLQRSILKT